MSEGPMQAPHYPIVYIRGYAATQAAVEDTVADPYMGFNIGSTKLRQQYSQDVVRHIFESPLVRLTKDEGYRDVYDGGAELHESSMPPARSVWIYRYYEPVSKELGDDFRPTIKDYAEGLGRLLDRMQLQYSRVDGEIEPEREEAFRVHLVAHSMGGLIARCFLQNISSGDHRVDKVFTYATPHGGIDMRWVGNVPDFLRWHNTENFNRKHMRQYLKLGKGTPVNVLDGKFDPNRFFCLVGTNYRDYGVAKHAVGEMSDGLVQIKNAAVKDAPRAFVHRSHSGHYGIVNSEEGYQNLRRFLFGDVRVDAYLDVAEVTLPPKVDKELAAEKKVRASYHIEVVARVRSVRWDLHRRTVAEQSAIFAQYDDLVMPGRRIHLASTFMSKKAKEDPRRAYGFSLDLRILVPEYVVDGKWLSKDHFEGGYLYRDKVNLEARRDSQKGWQIRYGFDSSTPNRATRNAKRESLGDGIYRFAIPVEQKTRPGVQASLHIETRPWT